jgi:hypothetical protein
MDDIIMVEVCKVQDVSDMLDSYATEHPEINDHIYQLKRNLWRECNSYLAKNMLRVKKAKDIFSQEG